MPCSSKKSEALLIPLKESIALYTESHSNVSIQKIQEIFGSPEEIAESYIDSLDKKEYKETINVKRRRKKVIIGLIIIILCAFIGLYISTFVYVKLSTPAYYQESIMEE